VAAAGLGGFLRFFRSRLMLFDSIGELLVGVVKKLEEGVGGHGLDPD
jgi:hypothetical protein